MSLYSYVSFLKENGRPLGEITPGSPEICLRASDALYALDLLNEIQEPILGGDILLDWGGSLVYACDNMDSFPYYNWYCNINLHENRQDYAKRSNLFARDFVEKLSNVESLLDVKCYVVFVIEGGYVWDMSTYFSFISRNGLPFFDQKSGHDKLCLTMSDALRAVDLLLEIKSVVLGGAVILEQNTRLVYASDFLGEFPYMYWYCERESYESEDDYIRRSHMIAKSFIVHVKALADDIGVGVYVEILHF